MGEALERFVEEAGTINSQFTSQTVFSIGAWDVSQYIIWLFIALAVVLVVLLVCARKVELVPQNKFVHLIEYLYGFVNKNVGEDVIGEGYKTHIPLLATLFFFILFANVIGLIPGCKTSTGTFSCTWALAAVSFFYFIFYGIKANGVGGYIKSLCPKDVPGPMFPIIWFLELFSTLIRILTLAVRLYGNMLAGHMVLAVFSLAITSFINVALISLSANIVTSLACVGASVLWFALLLVMYAMECLVAFVQAFVFSILTASYVSGAVHPH